MWTVWGLFLYGRMLPEREINLLQVVRRCAKTYIVCGMGNPTQSWADFVLSGWADFYADFLEALSAWTLNNYRCPFNSRLHWSFCLPRSFLSRSTFSSPVWFARWIPIRKSWPIMNAVNALSERRGFGSTSGSTSLQSCFWSSMLKSCHPMGCCLQGFVFGTGIFSLFRDVRICSGSRGRIGLLLGQRLFGMDSAQFRYGHWRENFRFLSGTGWLRVNEHG